MPKKSKPTSRAQKQLDDTEGMTGIEMEAYILALDETITPELAAKYLSGGNPDSKISAQGIRINMRPGGELYSKIGFCVDGRCNIMPERLVKYKRGELGVNSNELTQAITEMLSIVPDILSKILMDAVSKCI